MVTSVARSRRSCVLGDHGYAVPYRAYILAVSESDRRRDALAAHVREHPSQHDRGRASDLPVRAKGRALTGLGFTERRATIA